jgi:hypothetical protein
MVVASFVAGCGDPWTEVDVTIRVPPEVQAEYSAEMRGAVVGHLVGGSFDGSDILGILCEPTQDIVEVVGVLGGRGCRGDGTVTVWVEEPVPHDELPDCDVQSDFPNHYSWPSHEPPEGAPQASAPVFEGVDDRPCRAGQTAVTLTLEYP